MTAEAVPRDGLGRRIAVALLVAIGLALAIVVITADGPDAVSGGLGGDYPSFYALGFELSYLVNVLVMIGAVVLALRVLRPCSRVVRDHGIETLAAALTFYPLFRGVTGGQNTALSLLAFAVVWRSLHDGREIPAGTAAGLLLFKPPLALPILGALLLGRRFLAAAASMATAVGLYVIGALLTGPTWPAAWLDAVQYLDEIDTPFNVQNFVSLPGAAEAVFGIDAVAALVVGFALAAVVVVLVSLAWLRGRLDVDVLMAITIAGTILVSPQALYYDAGLLVLVGLVLADRRPDLRPWLVLLWVAGFVHLLADPLGVDPLVLVVVVAFGLALTADRRAILRW